MNIEIKREETLKKLDGAIFATTKKVILEQSNAFVFHKGQMITFDGEVCTRQPSPFGKDFEGGIIAEDFLKIFQRFPDETLTISQKEGELIIKGKHRSAGIVMVKEVLLPYKDIPTPEKMFRIPEGMPKAILQASRTCGKDETTPKTTHVHIASDRIEGTDSFRIFRAVLETGLKKPLLVHAPVISRACGYNLKKWGHSGQEWFHLLTEGGMLISFLCNSQEYYPKNMIDEFLTVKGKEALLPSNLPEILSRAEIMNMSTFSRGSWDSRISLCLKENQLKIESQKDEGWFRETRKVKYTGPEVSFTIHPEFLQDMISRTNKIIIGERNISMKEGNIFFATTIKAVKSSSEE